MSNYNLQYLDVKTGRIVRFRKLRACTYMREDGRVMSRNKMSPHYEFVTYERINRNFKYITTPNGFRVMVRNEKGPVVP